MPRPKPEGRIGASTAGGTGGSTGSSVRGTGSSARKTASSARKTAKVIKKINGPVTKAQNQLAADATAARNARMATTKKTSAYTSKGDGSRKTVVTQEIPRARINRFLMP
jgi:hypothetical protein